MSRLLLTAALALSAVLPAAAQTFQVNARPAGGTLRPRADGPAEALDFTVRAVSETGMDDCPGFVDPSAPDAVVEWPGGGDLRITTRADFDATLAVARPDGTWACNDDTDGLQPAVEIAQAARGRYAVWVGSLGQDPGSTDVTLLAGRPAPPPVPALTARPSGGTARLSAGFEGQDGATTREVAAGGLDAVASMNLQTEEDYGGCIGFVDASAPSLVVSYDGDGPLAITATSADQENATDLVLVVHTPAGRWSCNDDYASSDPTVVFDQAARGDYTVWAGTYQPLPRRATTRATISVSETAPEMPDYNDDYGDGDYGGDEPSGPYGEGTYMSLLVDQAPAARVAVAAEAVEVTASLTTAGTNPVSGPNCVGYLAAAPTADVVMSGGGPFGITALGGDEDDLVLVVRTPSGRWFCSDDADGLNPGIQFGVDADSTAEAGTYRVWVGSYRDPAAVDTVGYTPEPSSVTVRAERGVVVEWTESGMDDMGMEQPDFTEGTYEGTDLRPDAPMTTIALQNGAGTAAVTAGGVLINPVAGDACAGFLDARPTFALTAAGPLRISATAADDDLVMLVQTPSGQWLCSDDAAGSSNPAVSTAETGRHAVWIGTFSRRPEGVPATATVAPDGM